MGNNKTNKDADIKSYVGAPYNFIPVHDTIPYPQAETLPAHNSVDEELYSGSIAYTVTAKSEISIGGENVDGVSRFYKNADEKYAIPGSTMRGLIRSNAQILSGSYIGDDIDDLSLMYREFTVKGPLKERYDKVLGAGTINTDGHQISVLKNVRAGYIKNEGGKYVIYDTVNDGALNKGEMNYYVLSERYINEHLSSFAYLYTKEFGHPLQYKKGTVFESYDKNYIKHWKPKYKTDANENYRPFYGRISYKVNEKGRIYSITSPGDKNAKLKGFLCGTGFMNEKKALYVIPDIDKEKQLPQIPEKDVKAYNIDLNKKESILKGKEAGTYEYYALPKPGGEARPVFYIEYDGRTYFGYTPRLRLFYDHSIKEGLRQEKEQLDYVRAIFGYADEDDARKGRISFEDAAADGQVRESKERTYVLSGPKPTSYFDYLIKNGQEVSTYNDDNFGVRGVKQYWIKEGIDKEDPKAQQMKSTAKFETLPEGTVFRGTVHFKNLRKDELGLLLWSLSLEKESLQNIGKGKPYGFGVIDIKTDSVKRFDKEKAYCSRELCLDPTCDITGQAAELIAGFKAQNMAAGDSMNAFMTMKNNRLPNEKIRYMKLGDGNSKREYQERKKSKSPLPLPQEVTNDAGSGRRTEQSDQTGSSHGASDPLPPSPKAPNSLPKGFLRGTVKEISKEDRCGVILFDDSGKEFSFTMDDCLSRGKFNSLKKDDKVMFKKDRTGKLSKVQKLPEKYLD